MALLVSGRGLPRHGGRWVAHFHALALFLLLPVMLAGCEDQEQTGTTKPYAQAEAKPGAGVQVTAARANWDTGYFEAEIVAALLRELGYEVSSPAAREMSPDVFYPAVASRLVDFWANGWFPLHDAKLETALPTRGIVGDLASPVGTHGARRRAARLPRRQADRRPARHRHDERPQAPRDRRDLRPRRERQGGPHWVQPGLGLRQLHQRADRRPKAGWSSRCRATIAILFDDVVARVRQAQPVLYVTWTPELHDRRAGPRPDVTWLQAPSPPGVDTTVAGLAGCTGDPCETGFVPSSIRIVANNEFLEENPAARRLFELVQIDPQDIFEQNLRMRRGENTAADIERHAKQWIEANRAEVDRWLGEARSAAASN